MLFPLVSLFMLVVADKLLLAFSIPHLIFLPLFSTHRYRNIIVCKFFQLPIIEVVKVGVIYDFCKR